MESIMRNQAVLACLSVLPIVYALALFCCPCAASDSASSARVSRRSSLRYPALGADLTCFLLGRSLTDREPSVEGREDRPVRVEDTREHASQQRLSAVRQPALHQTLRDLGRAPHGHHLPLYPLQRA